jgi:hypothetical protein
MGMARGEAELATLEEHLIGCAECVKRARSGGLC